MKSFNNNETLELSILIVNWNAKDYLHHCLQSIPQAAAKISYEIVVVDNDSHDDSVAMLQQEFPTVKVIDSDINLGFARGNNLGLRYVNGKFIAVLNPDLVLAPAILTGLVQFLQQHPSVGLVGPKVFTDGSPLIQDFTLPSIRSAFMRFPGVPMLIRIFKRSRTQLLSEREKPQLVERVNGCCMVFRRGALEAIGGIPEIAFMYGEEIVIGQALKKAGFQIWYVPEVTVEHYDGGSVKQRWASHEKLMIFKAARIFAAHEVLKGHVFALWNLIFLIRECFYFLMAPLANLRRKQWSKVPFWPVVELHILGILSTISASSWRQLEKRYNFYAMRNRRGINVT